jgi:hypothetical protein
MFRCATGMAVESRRALNRPSLANKE